MLTSLREQKPHDNFTNRGPKAETRTKTASTATDKSAGWTSTRSEEMKIEMFAKRKAENKNR